MTYTSDSTQSLDIAGIDLFCGVGGLTHGLSRGGIRVTHGIDIDPECQYPYEKNNPARFVKQDVATLTSNSLVDMFGDAKLRLIAGCAPCQPFSTYSRKGRKDRNDKNWELISHFGRLVSDIQPEFVTMENVTQLPDHDVFRNFLEALKGYELFYDFIDCKEYGIPQNRRRLVLLASKLGPIKLRKPDSQEYKMATVRSAISHLRHISAGESDPNDALHTASKLSTLNLRRIRASKPGGTWRDWDEELVALCHRKSSGQTYPSVYGRMEWDAPAPTITTQCYGFGNGRFGHPSQDRAISLREAAILQTFPDDYQFLAPHEQARFSILGRLIGNAVPVRIGEIVAQSIIYHAHKHLGLSNEDNLTD